MQYTPNGVRVLLIIISPIISIIWNGAMFCRVILKPNSNELSYSLKTPKFSTYPLFFVFF